MNPSPRSIPKHPAHHECTAGNQRPGISVMVNLHSVELVKEYCTRVIGVAKGRIIFDDHPAQLTQDVLHRLYGDEISQLH